MAKLLGTGARRVFAIGAACAALVAGAVGLVAWSATRTPDRPPSETRRMPPADPLPGGPNNTAALDELRRRDAEDKARQAQRAGASYAVTMGGLDAFEPGSAPAPPRQVQIEQTATPTLRARPQQTPAEEKAVAQYDEAIKRLIRAWDGEGTATAMHDDKEPRQAEGRRGGAGGVRQAAGAAEGREQQPQRRPKRVLLPGNTGVYGVVRIGASSDEPNAPIVVAIHGGPLDGTRASGAYSLNQTRNGAVAGSMVKITRLTLADGRNVPVNAVLVAPEDMSTAVASRIDPHTAERIVYPMAAAFAQGLGRALLLSGSFVAGGPFGVSQGFNDLNTTQLFGVGAGAAGQAASQILREQAPRSATRHVDATSEVGVFFLDPVEVED